MMTGGVARNSAVVRALNEKLKTSIIIPPEPQIAGALGAALLAEEEISNS
jgi:(R)-2-hydroxyacyl-CoA dehydratese activating ATPase